MSENQEFSKFLDEIKEGQPKTLEQVLDVKEEVPPKQEEVAKETPEKESEPRKNRHHRRLEKQLEEERIARAAAEARANALLESKVGKTDDDAVHSLLIQLYGNEERGKEAANVNRKALEIIEQRATERALAEFERRQAEQNAEVVKHEQYLDSEFESLEDEYNVDFTSNAPAARKARNEMLEILEKISPKNEEGDIKEYADMSGVYEMWKLQHSQGKTDNSRQKELASRTMAGGSMSEQKPQPKDPGRFANWRQWAGLE